MWWRRSWFSLKGTVGIHDQARAAPLRHPASPHQPAHPCTTAASGYTKRARAETAISRFKRVIGDELRSHTDERRATEMDVAVHVLNRMLDLGRPTYVRIT